MLPCIRYGNDVRRETAAVETAQGFGVRPSAPEKKSARATFCTDAYYRPSTLARIVATNPCTVLISPEP